MKLMVLEDMENGTRGFLFMYLKMSEQGRFCVPCKTPS
jgi:hypothetical protein